MSNQANIEEVGFFTYSLHWSDTRPKFQIMNPFKSFWKGLTTPMSDTNSANPANFTPRACQVLALARKEADRFNHNFVGTEHLLLGLVKLGQGTAVNVLNKMGLNLENLRDEVERQVGTGPEEKTPGNIPYTPRVKKVLALAAKEAKALSHTYVGTEHILLGLLAEGDGVAARVLKNMDVDIDLTRQHILEELDPNFDAATSPMKRETTKSAPDMIDLTKRYDIYCKEGEREVIYRNALFKGMKKLVDKNKFDFSSQFIELEEADGQTVWVSRFSLMKFREHAGDSSAGPGSA